MIMEAGLPTPFYRVLLCSLEHPTNNQRDEEDDHEDDHEDDEANEDDGDDGYGAYGSSFYWALLCSLEKHPQRQIIG